MLQLDLGLKDFNQHHRDKIDLLSSDTRLIFNTIYSEKMPRVYTMYTYKVYTS